MTLFGEGNLEESGYSRSRRGSQAGNCNRGRASWLKCDGFICKIVEGFDNKYPDAKLEFGFVCVKNDKILDYLFA